MSRETVERRTGALFGDLWSRYDDRLFKQSVELFERRWHENGEPADHFQGKHCLDAGCGGGGRYSFAMAQMGPAEVLGVDVGEEGSQTPATRRRDRRRVRLRLLLRRAAPHPRSRARPA